MKILDTVKCHGDIAFVVDEMPALAYEMMTVPISACNGSYEKSYFAGRKLLVGSDESGVFYDVLYHRVEVCGCQAFGGQKFSLTMKDGTTFTTDGWWWDDGLEVAEKMLEIKLGSVTIQSLHSLQKCFVFTRLRVDTKKFDQHVYRPFVEENGKIEPRDYFEYDREIRSYRRD